MIPRIERSPVARVLVTTYCILMAPVILTYMAVVLCFYLAVSIFTLPWTLYFYSSNWGLSPEDSKTAKEYAELVQTRNSDVVHMLRYIKSHGGQPSTVHFYPHKAERSFYCIPILGSYQSATYTYPLIALVFMRLEDAGWRRDVVYDLFEQTISDGTGRQRIKEVKKKSCRGEILVRMGIPAYQAASLPVSWMEQAPDMLKADRSAIDMDMKDAKWILSGHSLIRPRDRETLNALGRLNAYLGMWKFVTKEEDLMESGYWQFVLL